ncbi:MULTISPECIES: response regulator [Legionella]|uniref:response regulator n=1 Tax=Legionella TaxID=445 RepID=UPI000F8DEA15|nr:MULTISPECIES: response regulator [Legionella]MCP0912899.1 response regulator [Legionella sp. 27cVA30]RUR10056.1 response regulator [Legionella septentrionalis]
MLKPYSLLIVEPSLAARVVIRSQFLDLEHHLDIAWNFESAIEYITFKLYDLILIDITLNERRSLFHQIKKNSLISNEAPIMGLSSQEDYVLIEKKKERVFRKPFTKADVIKIIEFLDNLKRNT